MQRIPSAGTAISRAAAAEIPSRMHRPDRALAVLAALPMSMRPRTQTAIIIARLRSKTARILHSIKNLFRLRRLLHRRIPYNPPPKRWRAHSLKPRLLAPESSRTPRAKPPCRPAPDVHRAMWQLRRTMQRPRQQKPRPVRRIVPQELRSLSWAARSCKMRSRNNPYIPNQNSIRAAAHRYRIMLARFRSVRQEKRQVKIRCAVPISRSVPQESRIIAAMHRDRRYRPNPRSSAAPLYSRTTHRGAHRMRPLQMQGQTILHRRLPLRAIRHSLSAAQEYLDSSGRVFESTRKIFADETKRAICDRLQGAFSYTNISRSSLFQEEKYMNLWVALESLARTDMYSNIISNVKETVPAAICIRYIYRIVRNFAEDCKRCRVDLRVLTQFPLIWSSRRNKRW